MDLTKPGNYPRSGREQVGGVAFLPRSIDKMRAHIAGTAGEYNALRGLSSRVYNLYGVTPEQFMEGVQQNADDAGVLRWLQEHGTNKPTQQDIEQHNQAVMAAGPANEEAMARFRANLARLGHGHRTDVKTHVDAEDLEEGREVPPR